MKRFALLLLCLLVLLVGCGKNQDVILDDTFVILCAEESGSVREAALSLQVALMQKCNLELEVVTEAPAEAKTITVAVEDSLEDGSYRTRIADGSIFIEAGSSDGMVFAMRQIRREWLGESEEPKLKAEKLDALCGEIDLANAPFLALTQNIRYLDDEGGNMVAQRAPRFNQLVTEYQPDLILIQEDNYHWCPILEKLFEDMYGVVGTYSDGPEGTRGNRQSIFFRKDRYELVDQGALWLSDTPSEPYTKFADSKSCRHCTWAILKDTFTGRELFVCNTHLDTASEEVRLKQLAVLQEHMGGYMEQYPTLLVGDFNSRPDGHVYATVTQTLSDPHVTAAVKLNNAEFTYDKYGTEDDPRRLDYLFYNDGLVAETYRVMIDLYNGYVSDHYGVTTQYSFAK